VRVVQMGMGVVTVAALRSNFNVNGSNHRRTGNGRPLPGGRHCEQIPIAQHASKRRHLRAQ
jgi:hypothetical protein